MKKQLLCMFFAVLVSNVCKSMDKIDPGTWLNLLKAGIEPIDSIPKVHLPSQEIMARHLNTFHCNIFHKDLYTTLSQKLGNKNTSIGAIQYCSAYIITQDATYKALSKKEQSALIKTITDAIVSLELPSYFLSSSSSEDTYPLPLSSSSSSVERPIPVSSSSSSSSSGFSSSKSSYPSTSSSSSSSSSS